MSSLHVLSTDSNHSRSRIAVATTTEQHNWDGYVSNDGGRNPVIAGNLLLEEVVVGGIRDVVDQAFPDESGLVPVIQVAVHVGDPVAVHVVGIRWRFTWGPERW